MPGVRVADCLEQLIHEDLTDIVYSLEICHTGGPYTCGDCLSCADYFVGRSWVQRSTLMLHSILSLAGHVNVGVLLSIPIHM